MRFVSAQQLRDGLDIRMLVADLAAGHREPEPMMERVLLNDGHGHDYLVWHAWQPGGLIVTKMVTVFPENPSARPPHPSVQSIVTVFDGETGEPSAVIDGTELTYWKTAASSLAAGTHLARPDSETLVMVGAGGLAPYLVHGYRRMFPELRRVVVWNRTRERAEALSDDPRCLGPVEVAGDLRAAVMTADIVCSVTASAEPLIDGEWLQPGTHLDLIGGYTPAMREANDTAVRRARLFVDSFRFSVDHCGDICQPIAAGVIQREAIHDLFDLSCGRHPGRVSREEITLYKSGGGAHLDLMAARHVLATLPEARPS